MKTKRQKQFWTGFRSVQRLHSWVTAKVLMLLVMLVVSVQGAWALDYYKHSGVTYILREVNYHFYAEVDAIDNDVVDAVIPVSVTYNDKDYVVTDVIPFAFQNKTALRSVIFEDGSEVSSLGLGFTNDANLERVVLPKGIRYIDQDCFRGCTKLTSIIVPEHVEQIFESAFNGCSSLTTVILPDGITSIGTAAFKDCISLKQLTLPNSLTELGFQETFMGCTALENIRLSNGITKIPLRAFSGCTSLRDINLTDRISSIERYAFDGCKLRSIHIPAGMTNRNDITSVFYSMIPTLEEITVSPENPMFDSRDNCNAIIETSNRSVILGCRNTIIPNDATILDYAFGGCEALTTITLPQNVTISGYAFSRCNNLETIICTSSKPENISFYGSLQIDKNKVTVMVPHNLLDFYKANYGFRNNFNVNNIVSNPATIKRYFISKIGNIFIGHSFDDNLIYHSDYLSDYTSINDFKYGLEWDQSTSIFQGITGLIFVKHTHSISAPVQRIPDELVVDGKIYKPIYYDWRLDSYPYLHSYDEDGNSVETTYFPYITRDGNDLSGAKMLSGLEFVYSQEPLTDPDFVRGLNAVYDSDQRGHVFSFTDNQDWNECAGTGDGHTYTYVKAIYETFQTPYDEIHYSTTDDTQLDFENGAFGDNVIAEHTYKYGAGVIRFTNIVNGRLLASAFAHKANVKHVILPPGITEIADGAFEGCTSLENISFSPDMRYIRASAFKDCQSLLSFTLTKRLTTLGEGAFENCSSLSRIEIPKHFTSLGANVFKGCTSLEIVKLPATITSIGAGTFENCSGLKDINIADLVNITSIGNRAFYGCSSLAKVEFVDLKKYDAASLVECEVGEEAFANCTGMNTITTPKMSHIPSKLFAGCNTLRTVYVPVYTGDMGNDIADDAFVKKEIHEIHLMGTSGITTIPSGKFRGFSQLREFEFPYSLESIGAEAFVNTRFTYLGLGLHNKLTDIGAEAFGDCMHMTDVYLPSSLTTIKARTFRGCAALKTLNLNNSVQTIEEQAFEYCSNLQTIVFGKALRSIGRRAFYGCKSDLEVVADLEYEGVYASNTDCFDAAVYANGTLHRIGDNKNNNAIYSKAPWSSFTHQEIYAYHVEDGCSYQLFPDNYETPDGRKIRGAVLISGGHTHSYPEYVHGDYPVVAFATGSISNVESICIPRNVIRLEEGFVTSSPRFWSIDFGSGKDTLYVDKTLNYPTLHEILIRRNVECLKGGLFEGLQSTSDNDLVLKIGDDASYLPKNCFKNSNLKKIEYRSKQVFGFDEGAFAGCKQIRDIMVLTSFASMDETRCSSKTFETEVNRNANLRWEGNADEIERYKFYEPWINFYEPKETQVTYNGATYKIYPRASYSYNIKEDFGVHNITGAVLTGGSFSGDVVIPEKVANFPVIAITKGIFNENDNVTSISFPGTLRMIENNAVEKMSNLKKVEFRDQLFPRGEKCYVGYAVYTVEDEEAFYKCDNLETVIIGCDIDWEESEDEPFEDRDNLKRIRITAGCHSIGKEDCVLFNDCDTELDELIFDDCETDLACPGKMFSTIGITDWPDTSTKNCIIGRSFGDIGIIDVDKITLSNTVTKLTKNMIPRQGIKFGVKLYGGKNVTEIADDVSLYEYEVVDKPWLKLKRIGDDVICPENLWVDPANPWESSLTYIGRKLMAGNTLILPPSIEYVGEGSIPFGEGREEDRNANLINTPDFVNIYIYADLAKLTLGGDVWDNFEIYDRLYEVLSIYVDGVTIHCLCNTDMDKIKAKFPDCSFMLRTGSPKRLCDLHLQESKKGSTLQSDGLYHDVCAGCGGNDRSSRTGNYYIHNWNGSDDIMIHKDGSSYTYAGPLAIDDSKPFQSPVNFSAESVSYNRTVTGGRVATFILPFASDAADVNGTVYKFRDFSDNKFCFDEQSGTLNANTPYLVVVDEEATQLLSNVSAQSLAATVSTTLSPLACNVTDGTAEHVGSFVQQTFDDGDNGKSYYGYASNDGMFVKAQTATLNPFRTMFTLSQSSNANARIRLQLGDDDTTSIINVDADLLDGDGSPMYDLNGRVITSPVHGQIYIQNGKKISSK